MRAACTLRRRRVNLDAAPERWLQRTSHSEAVPPASEAPPPRPSADTRLGRRRSSHLPCGFALAGFANRGRFYPRGCGLCRTVWATYNDGITRQLPSPTITLGRAGGGRSRTPPLTRFDRGLGARILQPPPHRALNRPTRPSRQGIRTGDLVKREHFLYGEALFLPATPQSNTHTPNGVAPSVVY